MTASDPTHTSEDKMSINDEFLKEFVITKALKIALDSSETSPAEKVVLARLLQTEFQHLADLFGFDNASNVVELRPQQ